MKDKPNCYNIATISWKLILSCLQFQRQLLHNLCLVQVSEMTQPVTILLIAVELACSLDLREKKGNKVNLVVKKIILKK